MNVWFLNHYAVPPCYFPLARQYNFGKYLIKDGHNVVIFAASTVHNSDKNLIENRNIYKIENIEGINYIYLRARNYVGNGIKRIFNMFDYFFRIFGVTKKIDKKMGKPDIIVATSVHPLTCVAGIKIAKRYNVKCIVEIADLWPLTLVQLGKLGSKNIITKLMYALEHWIYKKADGIIFTFEGGKDYIRDMKWDKDVDVSKVYYINNGIDLDEFKESVKINTITDVDIDNDDIFKIVYTGSMGKANNVINIVKCAEKIKNRENIKFLLFGDGYEKSNLEIYCKENNINNVVFKGRVNKKNIPYILSKSSLNIVSEKHTELLKYGLSLNKMFDYLASNKPVLSDIVCSYDILEKYNCGITVKSIDEMAETVLKFYNMDKSEYEKYCINAGIASKHFDFKNLTKDLEGIIDKNLVDGRIKNGV